MAWRAKVAKKTIQAEAFTVAVEFFDDVDPATILLREDMRFPPGISRAEMVAEIKARGARERAVQANLRQLADLVNVGDEVVI